LSAANDAWALTTVPPSSLKTGGSRGLPFRASATALKMCSAPCSPPAPASSSEPIVVMTAQAQADTAPECHRHRGPDPVAGQHGAVESRRAAAGAGAGQGVTVSATGATINISLTLPSTQFQELLQPKAGAHHHARAAQ